MWKKIDGRWINTENIQLPEEKEENEVNDDEDNQPVNKILQWLIDQKGKAKVAWAIIVTLMGILGYQVTVTPIDPATIPDQPEVVELQKSVDEVQTQVNVQLELIMQKLNLVMDNLHKLPDELQPDPQTHKKPPIKIVPR